MKRNRLSLRQKLKIKSFVTTHLVGYLPGLNMEVPRCYFLRRKRFKWSRDRYRPLYPDFQGYIEAKRQKTTPSFDDLFDIATETLNEELNKAFIISNLS